MRTIVIPDIHNRIEWIEPFLSQERHDEVVFLGDYFDNFDDVETEPALATARWLQQSLYQPGRIHLFGNHDLNYAFQRLDSEGRFLLPWMVCKGNTEIKFHAINTVLTRADWSRLKLIHVTQGWHLSHAGLHPRLAHPFTGFAHIEADAEFALEGAAIGIFHPVFGIGPSRNGRQEFGGLLWLDWKHEFQPIDGINQIVGHTVDNEANIRDNHLYNGAIATWLNYCIDTKSQYVAIIDNGDVTFKRVL